MKRFRWTKQQDFCLRLGLLKVVVSLLYGRLAGTPRTQLVRRFNAVLFEKAPEEMVGRLRESYGNIFEASQKRRKEGPTLADVLLATSKSTSWGQPIHGETSYKVLEWCQLVGLTSRGNRITERGKLLYTLFDADAVQAFIRGDIQAWNPFDLTPEERVFLLYHLGEFDELTWQILAELGMYPRESVLPAQDCYNIMLKSMEKILRRAESSIPLSELGEYRMVRELAETIAWELSPGETPAPRSRRVPSPRPIGKQKKVKRKSHKNADHQAIPRFEQLVDLGFLSKTVDSELDGRDLDRARKAWTFTTTDSTARFLLALGGTDRLEGREWHWSYFARAMAATGLIGPAVHRNASQVEALDLFVEAYDTFHRPAGQTPFESVALLTMIKGLQQGLIIEIKTLHNIMLDLKKRGGLDDQIFFAAGNEVDRMFILVGPDLARAFRKAQDHTM